jgi:hypothetical protein
VRRAVANKPGECLFLAIVAFSALGTLATLLAGELRFALLPISVLILALLANYSFGKYFERDVRRREGGLVLLIEKGNHCSNCGEHRGVRIDRMPKKLPCPACLEKTLCVERTYKGPLFT